MIDHDRLDDASLANSFYQAHAQTKFNIFDAQGNRVAVGKLVGVSGTERVNVAYQQGGKDIVVNVPVTDFTPATA